MEIQGVRGLTVTIQTVTVCLCCGWASSRTLPWVWEAQYIVLPFLFCNFSSSRVVSGLICCFYWHWIQASLLSGSLLVRRLLQKWAAAALYEAEAALHSLLCFSYFCTHRYCGAAVKNDVTLTVVTSLCHTICKFNQRLQAHVLDSMGSSFSYSIFNFLYYLIYVHLNQMCFIRTNKENNVRICVLFILPFLKL